MIKLILLDICTACIMPCTTKGRWQGGAAEGVGHVIKAAQLTKYQELRTVEAGFTTMQELGPVELHAYSLLNALSDPVLRH